MNKKIVNIKDITSLLVDEINELKSFKGSKD